MIKPNKCFFIVVYGTVFLFIIENGSLKTYFYPNFYFL